MTNSPKKKKKKRAKGTVLEENDYLQREEIDQLFRVITDKRDRAIFTITYQKGLRAHEVGLLQLADFRARDGYLFIHRGKGSISRHHALTKKEQIALRAWLKVRGSAPGPLFPSRQGSKGITRTRLDQLMKQYCAAAGIAPEKAHMHALKHSCGTHLRERGEPADVIQDWLGHRDPKSTEIYLHFSRHRRDEAAERNRDW
jgi:integrase